jgi:acyl carrier protein
VKTVAERVTELLVAHLGVKSGEVISGAILVDDLGADSMDEVELTMALEEEFEITIPDEDARNLVTVEDVIEYIQERTTAG